MSNVELERSRAIAAKGGRLRVGCWACDFVGDLQHDPSSRPSEAYIHGLRCPECFQEGGMHEYPTAGTWPSEYNGSDDCPVAPDAVVSQ